MRLMRPRTHRHRDSIEAKIEPRTMSGTPIPVPTQTLSQKHNCQYHRHGQTCFVDGGHGCRRALRQCSEVGNPRNGESPRLTVRERVRHELLGTLSSDARRTKIKLRSTRRARWRSSPHFRDATGRLQACFCKDRSETSSDGRDSSEQLPAHLSLGDLRSTLGPHPNPARRLDSSIAHAV